MTSGIFHAIVLMLLKNEFQGGFAMKSMDRTGNQITEGVIWKQLLLFFFPIVLGTFFQQLYNTIDAVIVGRFVGKAALASVGGSAGQIINLVVGFFTGLASGASVIISQFYGARDKKNLQQSLHTAYAFSIIGSIIITAIGIWAAPAMLELMHTPTELLEESTLYLRIYFGGIIFVFIYNVGSSIMRAVGDSKRPLYYLIVCCVINVVLDIVFVLVFHMGITGVAVATLIAQAVSAVLVTAALAKSTDILHLSLNSIRPYKSVLISELRIGLPGGLQTVMYNISNVIIQASLNSFGTDTAAAWAAYGKLDAIYWMMSGAFGIAITTFVGQNYGAGKYGRIKKGVYVCLGIDFFAALILIIFLLVADVPLFHIFTTDKDVVRIGVEMLEMITPCYIFFVFIEVLSGALRGVGDVFIPMIITMLGVCVLRILWVVVAVPMRPAVSTIIFSYPITWVLTAGLFIVYYFYKQKGFPRQ